MKDLIRRLRALPRPDDCLHVFTTRDGNPYTDDGFASTWQRAMAKAPADQIISRRFTFHDLRAYYTTSTKLSTKRCLNSMPPARPPRRSMSCSALRILVAWGWIPPPPAGQPLRAGSKGESGTSVARIVLENPAAICSRLRHDQVSAHARCGTRVPDADGRFEMNAGRSVPLSLISEGPLTAASTKSARSVLIRCIQAMQ